MSLRDTFRKEIFDSEQKPLLNFARNYFLGFSIDKDPDFEELEEFYVGWRDFNEYMVLQKQEDNLRVMGEVDKETFAVKCSKRGNDVYWWRVAKRLGFLNDLPNSVLFDPHSTDKVSNVLFVTLTYDIKRSTVRDAWDTIGEDFNNWIRNLRKKFGRISHLRCWEASKQGYPHIHILMIFNDYEFKVTRIRGKYRILEKESLNHCRTYIEGIRSQISFLNGIVLGLVVGIVGNLVAQYFSLVLEGWLLLRFDNLFIVNSLVLSVSAIVLISIILYFRKKRALEEKTLSGMLDSERNLIKRVEQIKIELEALKLDIPKR